MTDADNNAGEQGFDGRWAIQQKKSNGKRGSAAPHKPVSNGSKAQQSKDENPKESQEVKGSKRNLRTSRGPEDWGGYDGY